MTDPLELDKQAPSGVVAPVGDSEAVAPDLDKVTAELTELKQQITQKDKNYDELRSHSDKRYNEQADSMKSLMTQLKEQHNEGKAEKDKLSQDQFNTQWATDMDEKGGAAIMDFVRGTQSEVKSELETLVNAKIAELSNTIDPLRQQLEDTNPTYQANKDTVDKIMEAVPTMSRTDALKIAQAQAPSVSHPGSTSSPGALSPGTVSSDGSVPTAPVSLGALGDQFAALGVKPEELAKIGLAVAEARKS